MESCPNPGISRCAEGRGADGLHVELVRRGASILRSPQDEPYGLRDFAVEDLVGHRLVFGTPTDA